ncbi:ATP synthase subunit I [Zhongshania sp. BJYM1]|jgi:F1F0 ATPase subunit 2|uniref:ATP synthase subunit I n=1 Tax=Zhongshania aquatica TaxID=2965069 RepID=UPI0022B4CD18|nr:ATP synthase subunit I [Marortus sp. BJYM1]
MNSIAALCLAAVAGIGLGLFFYGGLYLTVSRGLNSQRPALWFFTSFVLRVAVVLTGFYFVNDGHWQRLVSCVTAFMIVGVIFPMWKKIPPSGDKISEQGNTHHAP